MTNMESEDYLSIQTELAKFCPGFAVDSPNDIHCLLDQLLKSLVEDEYSEADKLNFIYFLEQKSQRLCEDISDIELILATLKNVFGSIRNQEIQGQCLISSTTMLLEASEKFLGEEYDRSFACQVNMLLELVNQSNGAENVYARSVAADCLIEIEMCYPLILKPCLDNIYTVTIKEVTIAHQQYTSLLSLLMKHSAGNSQLGAPLWNTYPEIVFDSKFLKNNSAMILSPQSNNQLVSVLVDELPYCNPEAVVWITNHIVEILVHNRELRASCQVLKPLFYSCIYTFNCALFHLLLHLERVFGRELFEEEDHNLLVRQLTLNCCHPALTPAIRLLYLDMFSEYVSRGCIQLKCIQDIDMVLPHYFDNPDIKLKKFLFLSNTLKHKNGASTFLLQVIDHIRKGGKFSKTFKYKSVFIKSLSKLIHEYDDVPNDRVARMIVAAAIEDITVTPYILHFISQIRKSFPASQLPCLVLSSLVLHYTQDNENVTKESLTFEILIFQEAITSKCSIDCLKNILIYINKKILGSAICKCLGWILGHKLLKLCYIAMREFETSCFFYELKYVLQGFVSNFENDDIQDRAILYLDLLMSLSDKKLKTVLQGPRQALPNVVSGDTSFDPQIYFQKLDKPIVLLKKIKSFLAIEQNFQFQDNNLDILTAYKDFITFEPLCKQLTLKVSLSIPQEYKYLECIEALVIFVETPKYWGKVDPVMVGHFKEDSLHSNTAALYNMACYPSSPQPTQLDLRVEFSLENICHTCSINTLSIDFADFFCALPVDGALLKDHNFFKILWNYLESDFRSVVVLENKENGTWDRLEKKLSPFIISEDRSRCQIGIYLPPGNHLLMECNFQLTNIIIKFVTDFIHVLSFTNIFFKEFMK